MTSAFCNGFGSRGTREGFDASGATRAVIQSKAISGMTHILPQFPKSPLPFRGNGDNNPNHHPRMHSMPRFACPLHAPKLGAFGDLPAMYDGKAKALVQRDIMFVRRFQIGRQAVLICAV